MNILPEILKSLGIPENNRDMNLQAIIDSVLKANHPEVPEYSDISNQRISAIDENGKGTITMLEPNFPPFFSNILVLRRDEKDSLAKLLYRKFTYKKQDEVIPGITISASFVVPQICKIERTNKDAFAKVGISTKIEGIEDRCVAILLELIRTTKGVVEVSVEQDNETETISVLDLMGLVQMN